jgi:hypothetical protein
MNRSDARMHSIRKVTVTERANAAHLGLSGMGSSDHQNKKRPSFKHAGRICWTLQVFDLFKDFVIRPPRPPDLRKRACVHVWAQAGACVRTRVHARATHIFINIWTDSKKNKEINDLQRPPHTSRCRSWWTCWSDVKKPIDFRSCYEC